MSRGGSPRLARLARLAPTRSVSASRTPFVLLAVVLLAAGMITLLLLNAAVNQGSFELDELERETRKLTDERQALQTAVDARSAPDALQDRARELGLVPGGDPAFLNPDGTVLGSPGSPRPSQPGAPPAGPPRTGSPEQQQEEW